MVVDKCRLIAAAQLISGTKVQHQLDLSNQVSTAESMVGSFTLPKGGTAGKTIILMAPATPPLTLAISCEATFGLEIPSGGTRMTYDRHAVLGFATNNTHQSFAVTMISQVTHKTFSFLMGAKG